MKQNLFSCRSCCNQAGGAHLLCLDVALCVRDSGPCGTGYGQPVPLRCVRALARLGWALWISHAANCCLPLKGAGDSKGHTVRILWVASESDYFFFLGRCLQTGMIFLLCYNSNNRFFLFASKGYVYLVFESEKSVRALLQACSQDLLSPDGLSEYYFKMSSRRMRCKEVSRPVRVALQRMLMRFLGTRGCTALLQESRGQTGSWPSLIGVFCSRADGGREGSVRSVFVSFTTTSVRSCDLNLLETDFVKLGSFG